MILLLSLQGQKMFKRVRSSKYDKYYDINKVAQKYIFGLQPLELHFSSLESMIVLVLCRQSEEEMSECQKSSIG